MKEKLKAKSLELLKMIQGKVLKPLSTFLHKAFKFVFWNPIVIGILMFVVGARLNETGKLAGFLGKDYKGSTVIVTGTCKDIDGNIRQPALGADYVAVTGETDENLRGVMRKTLEVVDCDKKDISFSSLPFDLIANFKFSPPGFPDIAPIKKVKTPPEYLALSKKTLVISGTCSKQDGSVLMPFTDKDVDVTDIKGKKGAGGGFVLYGIRRDDQQAIKCLSTAIKYDLKKHQKVVENDVFDEVVSYKGKILMVSGTCVPDRRTVVKTKYSFFKFANDKVQILEEFFDEDNKLQKFVGMVMNEKYRGESVICDKTKWPFVYEVYDEQKHKLKGKSEAVEAAKR